MKRIAAMIVAAMMTLSFSMVAVAVEKKPFSSTSTAKKDAKKAVKKDKKGVKKDVKKKEEAKPAVKGKKEVSGC